MNRREALAALVALPAVKRIEVARLQPEDVIVIEVDGHPSDLAVARMEDTMRELFPGRRCLVLCDGAHMKIAKGV